MIPEMCFKHISAAACGRAACIQRDDDRPEVRPAGALGTSLHWCRGFCWRAHSFCLDVFVGGGIVFCPAWLQGCACMKWCDKGTTADKYISMAGSGCLPPMLLWCASHRR
jgi:hypothetical protein